MKRNCLLFTFACLSFWVKGQSNTQPILSAHVDTVYSSILKEKRPVWVYTPPFDTSYFGRPAYPVLYVLDADGYFTSLVTMVQQLSAVNGNTVLPQMIIVGIPNLQRKRTRDLTPTASSMETSGGGEQFTAFMEKELVPYIDKNYATAPYRALIGHSLGGLMAVNILMKHTDLFNAYIAIDPSMSYNNDGTLNQVTMMLSERNLQRRSLFLGIANTMEPGMDTTQVRSDTSQITHHLRSILKLKDQLQKHAANHLIWDYRYYPDDDHSSVSLIAEYDGLRFIFAGNKFPGNQPQNQYMDKVYTAAQLKELIRAHYKLMSEQLGYQVKPPESLMNQLGYTFLQQQEYDRAAMFFGVNIDYYPQSFNAYDSMGDYYLAKGEKTEAVAYFKKALALKYTQEIKDKLDKVVAEKK